MNKSTLIRKVTETLRNAEVKKPVSIPKQVFHISDDEGNSKDFTVKKTDKSVIYTIDDVTNIIDACLCVIEDALKTGDNISIHGFGSLGLYYRKPRKTKDISSGEEINIEGHFVPKFSFGNDLRLCAKLYELSLEDKLSAMATRPIETDDDVEDGDE